MMKGKIKYLTILLLIINSACSTQSDLLPREEVKWSPMRITDGPAAIGVGALAPVTCGAVTTGVILYSVFKDGGQAALAIPFMPFVTAFGIVAGTVRGTTMIVYGVSDLFTGSAWLLSNPYLNISDPGIFQWCFCFAEENCRDLKKLKNKPTTETFSE